MEYQEIPVFVKGGSILPFAKPVNYVDKNTVFEIRVEDYGAEEAEFILYEDDFESFDYEKSQNKICIRKIEGRLEITRQGSGPVRYHFN